MEIWKNIDGYDNYQVSNLGNVKSLNYRRTGKEEILKAGKTKDGYLFVILYKNGERKTYRVNRLVWETFNGKIPEGYQVNHISEDKTQNNLENLNLMSPKENVNYGTRNERAGKTNSIVLKNRKDCSKEICQYSIDGKLIKIWPSTMEIERELGFIHNAISQCCLGKIKTSYGYIWAFKKTG